MALEILPRDFDIFSDLKDILDKFEFKIEKINDDIYDYLNNHQEIFSLTNKDGETILHIATRNGSNNLVNILLELDMNPNISNNYGETPLIIAAQCGNKKLIEQLRKKVNFKGKASMSDRDGNNIVALLAKHGHTSKLKLIIKEIKKLNDLFIESILWSQNNKGETPLHLSIKQNKISTIKYILSHTKKGNCDICDNNGRTPLHLASESNNEFICKLLIKKGSKINVEDINGNTPLDYAHNIITNTRFIDFLRKKGAISNQSDLEKIKQSINII